MPSAPPAEPPSPAPRPSSNMAKHEEFKNQLVHDVFGRDNKGKVPMEKVAMLIWQFRDDPAVVQFMAQFVAKFSGSRQVFDGIEFYLPQIAHMIIHLEADWDEAILERFALVIAQQSQHFALQLTWILEGAIEDYQPETVEGKPNPSYNQLFYQRCITLLSNIERCVVYGSPRSIELQRMYEKGDISRAEYEQMKLEDRLNNARQITTHGANFKNFVQRVKETNLLPASLKTPTKSSTTADTASATVTSSQPALVSSRQIGKYGGYLLYKRRVRTAFYKRKNWKSRYFEIEERMLYCYNTHPSRGGRLVRAMPLEGATVKETDLGKYPYMFEVENHHYKYVIRATSEDDMRLWMKLLRGESEANALIPHIISSDEGDEEKKEDKNSPYKLSSSQQARYDFFKNERDFVASVCDVAEVLRFYEPKERKKLAPGLARKVDLPPCGYVPLCKSTDIWRRVDSVMADDTRVFNTNERCPMIYYFVAKRGERVGGAIGPNNPNLDVAEFLHMQFQVPDVEPLGKLEAIGEGDDHDDHEGQEITAISALGSNLDEDENEDEFELTMEDPTDGRKDSIWEDDSKFKMSTLSASLESSGKGNRELQKFMRENFVKLPSKLATRINRYESRRKMSYLDRNATPLKNTPIISTPIIEKQIPEGQSDDDSDCPSLEGRSVVSAGTGSVIFGDKVVAFEHADGIDKDSLDRAKAIVCGGESWAEKSARMLRDAKSESRPEETSVLEIVAMMAKSHDDLRQEVFVMQMIHYFESVFAKSSVPVWLKTYRILSTSKSTGLIEVLVDAISIDGLKKSEQYPETGGLRAYFEQVYGSPTSKSFMVAQRNFVRSLAGYSLVAYLLGLKDRHNGNIMIDTRGHIIHIDFGFAFGMAPGHEWSFERAPFKLTRDYIDVMGGTNSESFKEFQKLFLDGFKAARANSLTALGLVEIMMYKSNYPCFTGTRYGGGVSLKRFEKRLMLDVPDSKLEKKALKLIKNSIDHYGTKIYDIFQYHSNGLAY
ncbi:hypothetical protein HJC23_002395 [Cyclotella cryptica]|uniref:1-phosphatidylinositol 4-kinase n=1 Tax=Cyclotella cryptica TaxID=29204 RepID=A0ABD3QL19_9STRA|eukprot:CCRYP_004488-RA/>CCRYP_004488-RA protein AED:0.00 eAED:0.00 QI:367/1/1/1/1/1/2/313/1003